MRGIATSARDIGRVVREIRLAHGISQSALAEQLGVSQRYLSEVERGLPKILDDRYISLLNAVGVTLAYETRD